MRAIDPYFFAMAGPAFMVMMAVACWLVWKASGRRAELAWMGANQLALALALSAQILSRGDHAYVSHLWITAAYLVAAASLNQAITRCQITPPRLAFLTVTATATLVCMWVFIEKAPSVPGRITTVSLGMGALLLWGISGLRSTQPRNVFERIGVWLYLLTALACLTRPLGLLMGTEGIVEHSILWWGTLLLMAALSLLLPMSLMAAAMLDTVATLRKERNLDSLTGVLNRRALEERWMQQIAHNQVGTLILCDLDHFKHINDQHGHAVGDDVLRNFAQLLRSNLRHSDNVARLGGEEFAIIAWHLEPATAHDLVRRIQRTIMPQAAWSVRTDATLSVTASWGLTRIRANESLEQALLRADAQLYAAKHAGRNCIRSDDGHHLQSRGTFHSPHLH